MPAFCKFYAMQPSEFWNLSIAEVEALAEFMRDYARQQESSG